MRHVLYLFATANRANQLTFTRSIDQALDRPNLSLRTRKICLQLLHRMCGSHALPPESLKIPVSFERTGDGLYRGGFADMWKGEHCDRDVAVKVRRICSDSNLQRVIVVNFWCTIFLHACALAMPRTEVLRGGCRVENPPALQYRTLTMTSCRAIPSSTSSTTSSVPYSGPQVTGVPTLGPSHVQLPKPSSLSTPSTNKESSILNLGFRP